MRLERTAKQQPPGKTPLRLTSGARRRRDLAHTVLGEEFGRVLEIGAFDSPAFIADLGDRVSYLDWFSREELIEQHRDNPKRLLTNVVDVHYVVKDHLFAKQIEDRFDLIFAAHVVEHVADLASWLQQLESLLLPGGRIYLAVPDRRLTFDYYRRTSTTIEVLRAHEERLEKPSKWQILDARYYHTKVDLADLWEGVSPPAFRPRFTLPDALARAERASAEYSDTHCWVFTPESFAEVIDGLRECGLISLHVTDLREAVRGRNEFGAFLQPGRS